MRHITDGPEPSNAMLECSAPGHPSPALFLVGNLG